MGTSDQDYEIIQQELKRLKDSESRYRRLFETTQDGILMLDWDNGQIKDVNPSLIALLGYSKEELLEKRLWEFSSFKDLVASRPAFEELREKEYFRYDDVLLETSSGKSIDVELINTVYEVDHQKVILCNIRHITQRKQAEVALRKERDRAQSYLNIAGVIIVAIDTDQKVTLINAKGCQILGYAQEEILGLNWFDNFIPERMRNDVKAGFVQLLAGNIESGEDYENPVLTRGGEERLIAWHNAILQDEEGNITGTLSSGEDITEIMQTQHELRQAYELLEAVTKGTEVIIAAQDTNFRYLYFNKAYEEEIRRLTGKDIHVGASMVDLFTHMPEQQKISVEEWSRTLQGESTERILEFGEPGYYRRVYRILHTPLRDAQGNVVGAGEVAFDVTKTMQAEQALQEYEERFSLIFHNSPLAITITNMEDGIYSEVNDAFSVMSGYDREEVIGHNAAELTLQPNLSYRAPFLKQLRETGSYTNAEIRIRRKDGQIRDWLVNGKMVYIGAKPCILTMASDITDRKQTEKQVTSLAKFPEENPNPVLRVERDGKLVYANKASRALLDEWRCEVDKYIPQLYQNVVMEALSTQITKAVDVRCGEIVYSLLFVPIQEAGYVNLYGRDMTEQIKTAQALQNSYEELELRVQQRTQELIIANKQLQVEVNERRRIEESLRMANAYNRSLIEASLDPLVTITLDGKVGDVNTTTEAVTGYTRDELIGTDFHSYFIDPDKARAGYQQVFKTGSVRDYELEIRHKDGHTTPVLYNASIYRNEAGDVIGVFAAARDITKPKQAEIALRESEERYRNVVETSPNSIILTDLNQEILFTNQLAPAMHGFDRLDDLIGQSVLDLVVPDERERMLQNSQKTLELGILRDIEYNFLRSDGTHFPVELNVSVVKDVQGCPFAFHYNGRDITSRKLTEQALEAERQRLSLLSQAERNQRLFAEGLMHTMLALNSSLDMNEVLDQILEQIQHVISFRTADITLLEGDIIRIVRYSGFDDIPEASETLQASYTLKDFPLWQDAFTSRQAVFVPNINNEANWVSTPGLEWAQSFLCAPLQAGKDLIGFLNLISDQVGFYDQEAADRLSAFASQAAMAIQNAQLYRKLENVLVQEQTVRDQLVQTEKFTAMGRMLASVAHELNNPLQTIQNCMYLIGQDTAPDSPIQEYLDMAFSETERLSNLVSQLRGLYRPQSAKEFKPHHLSQIVDEVHSLLAPHLQNQHIGWQQSPGYENLIVNCIDDQIKQVFINVCMNAIEAMQPGGGTLFVELALSPKDASQAGVIFRDTGPGIPEEILKNIFEPFTTTKASGLGLGLSISYELVQRNNGRITADSQVNQGTTITVWLPRVEVEDIQQNLSQ